METYDSDTYTTVCSSCGTEDQFKRERQLIEQEHLELREGAADVHCEDVHVTGDWIYECVCCGNTGSDLEDILAEREDDDEQEV